MRKHHLWYFWYPLLLIISENKNLLSQYLFNRLLCANQVQGMHLYIFQMKMHQTFEPSDSSSNLKINYFEFSIFVGTFKQI